LPWHIGIDTQEQGISVLRLIILKQEQILLSTFVLRHSLLKRKQNQFQPPKLILLSTFVFTAVK
jgi:hypothetical protein